MYPSWKFLPLCPHLLFSICIINTCLHRNVSAAVALLLSHTILQITELCFWTKDTLAAQRRFKADTNQPISASLALR